MKYDLYTISFQELPTETSLVFTITGCLLRCDGCHSPHLWKETGTELTDEVLDDILNKYKGYITAVVFMGGEWHKSRLIELLTKCRDKQLKTCLYTGEDFLCIEISALLDYAKLGKYDKKLGGLESENTNQRMIDITNKKEITYLFKGK